MNMSMQTYLNEVRDAVKNPLLEIWNDHTSVHQLLDRIRELEQTVKAGYRQAKNWSQGDGPPYGPLDIDSTMAATGVYWDNYFGPDRQLDEAETDLEDLKARLVARRFAMGSLAGHVLQVAKQGVSLVHKPSGAIFRENMLSGEHRGRVICKSANGRDLRLLDFIWFGRNQAIHWEDDTLSQHTSTFFLDLSTADSVYTHFETEKLSRSLAFGILHVIDWCDWDAFEKDMLLLA